MELIEEHGVGAYPFTPERIDELEKAKQEPQSLESLLVFGGNDFVIGRGGSKVTPFCFFSPKSAKLSFSFSYL